MDEIKIVGPGKTHGYPYPVCKKRLVSPGISRGYPHPVCKTEFSSTVKIEQTLSHRYEKPFQVLILNVVLHGDKCYKQHILPCMHTFI